MDIPEAQQAETGDGQIFTNARTAAVAGRALQAARAA
jgi:hypothetical protein